MRREQVHSFYLRIVHQTYKRRLILSVIRLGSLYTKNLSPGLNGEVPMSLKERFLEGATGSL